MRLYYFTGTGNSLAVARRLAREFPGTELRPLLGAEPGERPTGVLGIAFPVHMVGVPIPLRRYLESADFSTLDYLFAIGTHSGTPGHVGAYINRILARRSSRLLDDYFPFKMILNTPKGVAPRLLMTMNWAEKISPTEVAAMVARTAPAICEIARTVAARSTRFEAPGEPERVTRPSMLTRLLWKASERSTPSLSFLLDRESCTGCGVCREVCPSGRVVMYEGAPRWGDSHQCYFCYACFNFCPEQAIGVKHYAFKTGRYHHPEIAAVDVAAQKRG
ncbi:MAG: 4Fe-4S dicluster domain-containing protein [Spirochaetaceae bacterium]|nr:MAG: 4Fe-4S dicluster domain-containing protein [Spirochaetaceae bacterium]